LASKNACPPETTEKDCFESAMAYSRSLLNHYKIKAYQTTSEAAHNTLKEYYYQTKDKKWAKDGEPSVVSDGIKRNLEIFKSKLEKNWEDAVNSGNLQSPSLEKRFLGRIASAASKLSGATRKFGSKIRNIFPSGRRQITSGTGSGRFTNAPSGSGRTRTKFSQEDIDLINNMPDRYVVPDSTPKYFTNPKTGKEFKFSEADMDLINKMQDKNVVTPGGSFQNKASNIGEKPKWYRVQERLKYNSKVKEIQKAQRQTKMKNRIARIENAQKQKSWLSLKGFFKNKVAAVAIVGVAVMTIATGFWSSDEPAMAPVDEGPEMFQGEDFNGSQDDIFGPETYPPESQFDYDPFLGGEFDSAASGETNFYPPESEFDSAASGETGNVQINTDFPDRYDPETGYLWKFDYETAMYFRYEDGQNGQRLKIYYQ
jgi:hypothetical protein